MPIGGSMRVQLAVQDASPSAQAACSSLSPKSRVEHRLEILERGHGVRDYGFW
jgi:hypothetical protein